jgi:hypothetical protein
MHGISMYQRFIDHRCCCCTDHSQVSVVCLSLPICSPKHYTVCHLSREGRGGQDAMEITYVSSGHERDPSTIHPCVDSMAHSQDSHISLLSPPVSPKQWCKQKDILLHHLVPSPHRHPTTASAPTRHPQRQCR